MRCVDCGQIFEEIKSVKSVKVITNNPGAVIFPAKTSECPKCHQHFLDEEDFAEVAAAYDEGYAKQQSTKAK